MLSQALEIIFEVQRKRSDEKIIRKKKKLFNLKNMFFFSFFLFEPLLLSNLITFLFFIHFWQFKDEHTRDLLGVLGTDFDSVQWFGFLSSWPSLRGCNFCISYSFLTIVSVSDVPRGGFKFCLDIRNNWALPLDPACPECLSSWLPAGLP